MLKYRIERFFRANDNKENFYHVCKMIENNITTQNYRNSPDDFLHYLEHNGIIKRNPDKIGAFLFTPLGKKYYDYYKK